MANPMAGISLVDMLQNMNGAQDPALEFQRQAELIDNPEADPFEAQPDPAFMASITELEGLSKELEDGGINPMEAIVAPPRITTKQVSSPGSMNQIRSLARDLRKIGVPDREILKSVKQARIKQLTSKTGGKDSFAVLSDDEVKELNLPKGTVAQRNKKTGRVNVLKSPSGTSREKVMRKLASGKEIITPGERDVLLLNIKDVLQREEVQDAVARHNAALKAAPKQRSSPPSSLPKNATEQPTPSDAVRLPQNPALRIEGRRYKHPQDPSITLVWRNGKAEVEE